MPRVEAQLSWCLKQEERGHPGLRRMKPDSAESQRHVEKALHNLKAFDHNKAGFPDWAVSAAFYAMYHALLALLAQNGYESRNQECTLAAVEHLIATGSISLDARHLALVRQTGRMMPSDAKSLREQFQYGTAVSVDSALLDELQQNAIGLVEAVQLCLEGV